MNKVILFLMIFVVSLFAQNDAARYWGKPYDGRNIRWGNRFIATDSLRLYQELLPVRMSDPGNTDTLWTDMMLIPGDGNEGIIMISFSADSVVEDATAGQDSIRLYVRFYFNKDIHTTAYWESTWYNLNTNMSDNTLYLFRDIASDSTWWGPATGWQFKVERADVDNDTLDIPNLGIYLR